MACFLVACGSGPAAVSFTAPDGSFQAVFPVVPARSVRTMIPSGVSVDVVTFEAQDGREDVGVSTIEGVTTTLTGDALDKALDAGADAEAAAVSGTVTSRVTATVAAGPAEDAVIARPGWTYRARVIAAGTQFFILFGGVPAPGRAHPGYDRLLATFEPGTPPQSPSPSVSPSPSETPSASVSPTPSASVSPTASPSVSETASVGVGHGDALGGTLLSQTSEVSRRRCSTRVRSWVR